MRKEQRRATMKWRMVVGRKEWWDDWNVVCWFQPTRVITKQDGIATHLLSTKVHCSSFSYTLLWFDGRTVRLRSMGPSCKPSFRHPCWTPPNFAPPRSPSSHKKNFNRNPKGNARPQTHLWPGEKFFADNRPRNTPHHAPWRARHPCEEICCEHQIPPETRPAVVSFQEEAGSQFAECLATS